MNFSVFEFLTSIRLPQPILIPWMIAWLFGWVPREMSADERAYWYGTNQLNFSISFNSKSIKYRSTRTLTGGLYDSASTCFVIIVNFIFTSLIRIKFVKNNCAILVNCDQGVVDRLACWYQARAQWLRLYKYQTLVKYRIMCTWKRQHQKKTQIHQV